MSGRGRGGRTGRTRAEAGVLRIFPPEEGATRIVLVRHGEAECNLNHVIGGPKGCTGLTDLGRRQVAALADRLYESGELREATALYSSVLPRAIETAERLRPVVGPGPDGPRPGPRSAATSASCTRATADGMEWSASGRDLRCARLGQRPDRAHRARAARAGPSSSSGPRARCAAVVREHPGELVVAAVHAGVIEATMIAFLGVAPEVYRRGWVRIVHASMTEWEWVPSEDRFVLLRFNDSCGVPRADRGGLGRDLVEEGAGQGLGRTGKPGILDRLTQGLLGGRP